MRSDPANFSCFSIGTSSIYVPVQMHRCFRIEKWFTHISFSVEPWCVVSGISGDTMQIYAKPVPGELEKLNSFGPLRELTGQRKTT